MAERGESEAAPEEVRIFVRFREDAKGDGWIWAGETAEPPETPTDHPGGPTLGLLQATQAGRSGRRNLFTEEAHRDLGTVLFQRPEVRERIARLVAAGRFVRFVLDLELEASGANWEAARPPRSPIGDDAESGWRGEGWDWNVVPDGPIGLWGRFAVVRYNGVPPRNRVPQDALFPATTHSLFVVDARDLGDGSPSLADAELPAPRRAFKVEVRDRATPSAFSSSALRGHDAVHFVGHGTPTGLRLRGANLTWKDAEEHLKAVDVRLAVLAACATGAANPLGDQISFAWHVSTVVPGVVAMLAEVRTNAANVFTSAFYNAVDEGTPVDFAVTHARRAMFEALAGDSVASSDWMLPVLFLAIEGDARVPDATAPPADANAEARREALALAVAEPGGVPLRLGSAGRRFRFAPPESDAFGPVTLSARGDVSVAASGGSLLVSLYGGDPLPDDGLWERLEATYDEVTLLAVRQRRHGTVQLAVGTSTGTVEVIRHLADGWGDAVRVTGSALTAGVYLDAGLLGWDGGGLEGPARGSGVPRLDDFETVAGLDAVVFDTHEVLAAWGTGLVGRPIGRVFVRRRGAARWREADLRLTDIVQLGIVRPFVSRARSSGTGASLVVASRQLDGTVALGEPIDLEALE